MSTLSFQVPDSLHRAARELASKDGVPVEHLAATALAEKVAALQTLAYLRERAIRGDLAEFDRTLALVPDVAPEHESDRLP